MKTVKVHNKMQGANKIFGLEILDLLALLIVYLVVFVISANLLLNLAFVLAAYLVLRIYKKSKTPHWTGSAIRFLIRPVRFFVKREKERDLFES